MSHSSTLACHASTGANPPEGYSPGEFSGGEHHDGTTSSGDGRDGHPRAAGCRPAQASRSAGARVEPACTGVGRRGPAREGGSCHWGGNRGRSRRRCHSRALRGNPKGRRRQGTPPREGGFGGRSRSYCLHLGRGCGHHSRGQPHGPGRLRVLRFEAGRRARRRKLGNPLDDPACYPVLRPRAPHGPGDGEAPGDPCASRLPLPAGRLGRGW